MGIFANVPGINVNITGPMFLPACTLAGIYMGQIKSWADPSILNANPIWASWATSQPSSALTIQLFRRSAYDSSSVGLDQYLSSTCPSVWVPGSLANAPATRVIDRDTMVSSLSGTPMGLGYAELGIGKQAGLQEVALQLYSDPTQFRTSATATYAAAVASGPAIPSSPTSDFSSLSFVNMPSDSAYPITMMTYMILRTDLRSLGSSGGVLRALIRYLLSAEGQAETSVYGFAPLPPSIAASSLVATNFMMIDPYSGDFFFENSGQVGPLGGPDLPTPSVPLDRSLPSLPLLLLLPAPALRGRLRQGDLRPPRQLHLGPPGALGPDR